MKRIYLVAAMAALTLTISLAGIGRAFAADTRNAGVRITLPPALASDTLAGLSGGAGPSGVAISQSTLTAVNSGNAVNADSLVTGDVTISPNAFDGFNGVGNFVFNTGNNNNVQGSLNITILTPAN